ncbi:PE family protein [Mycobacterium sp. SM1]|uniref:PE family protein n=1 Tax=Mycobacterium sp. SM1 TaxID=2816243 RepID=UPI001BCE0EED|nr:PE family protein [Mycobacterium sp. SM1]MBS4730720.1 PE family protein [Mycobacterium sp. SM1]
MSYVIIQPETLIAATSDLQRIGAAMSAGNAVAAVPTTEVMPAASDAVSVLTATQFATHAAMYQAAGNHAAVVHDLFVAAMGASARSYADTEGANAIAAS